MTSQANDQEPPSSVPKGERPSGTRMHNWLDAEAEARQIGDLARQLVAVDGQVTRQIPEGKEAEVRRTEHLARHLVEAEERLIRQIAEGKEAERRLVAEHAVSRILGVSATLSDAAPKILQAVCESLDWDFGALWRVDRNANALGCVEVWHTPEVQVPALEQYTRHITFPPGSGMPGSVWASQALVWIPDLTTEADSRLPIAVKEGMHGAVGFPIRKGTEFHGVMSFFSREIRQPNENIIEMMNSIGSQISQFIDRKVAERRLAAEHAVSRILAASDTLSDAASKIIQPVCESLDWDVGTVWVVDRKANVLQCAEVWHKPMVEIPAFEQICRQRTYSQQGIGLPSLVWANKSLAWFPDLSTDAHFVRWPIAIQEGLHAAIGFPITNGIEFLGVIEFFSRKIRQPDEELIEMMNSIGSHIGLFIERRKAHKELHRQEAGRHIARQIQQGLLPNAMPRFAGYNISGRSSTADEVGGDWFDYIPLVVEGQECLDVLVGDVSGHGIAAALLAGQTRAYLRAFALTYSDVGTLLTLTNHRLATDLVTYHFVTLLLVQLDPRSLSLHYASAGHCPGYVLDHQGQIKAVLASTGTVLGIESASEFPTGPSLTLKPGDLVFLYTDGIVEAGSSTGEPFGLERTLDVVRAHQQETADEILEALFNAVGDSEHHLEDDQTAVIIKVKGVA